MIISRFYFGNYVKETIENILPHYLHILNVRQHLENKEELH